MALHFSDGEFSRRKAATIAGMEARGLDALLIFRQESGFWLTGYDTFGYVFFQCIVLRADGDVTLLTRSADYRQAQMTSNIPDIRIWKDAADANPAQDLKALLAEKSLSGKRLGVEYDAYGLTAANGKKLDAALDGFATAEDASDIITKLRVIKSAEELVYVRRAAELADDAWIAAQRTAKPRVNEGTVLAAMQGAVFEGGGDYPGNEFIIGAGDDALLCRYYSGRKNILSQDQMTLEWAGTYRHYHAAMMRTMLFGEVSPVHQQMYDVAHEALLATFGNLNPGATFGDGFAAHARVMDSHGLADHRLNACGYSLGTTFAPNWMDWPMLYADNPVVIEPGMVIFCHMILMNSDERKAMCLGQTVEITETGAKQLSASDLDLIVVG